MAESGGFVMGLDPLYLIVALASAAFSALATGWVKSAYHKYSRVANRAGLTGADAAREMLRREGVDDVAIERVAGELTDHYDPGAKVIRLSANIYDGRSVAALGIACHEAGHALQHAQAYAPLALRSLSIPLASLGGKFGPLIIVAGLMLGMLGLVKIGLVLFAAVFVFQLITLPVEFNASTRARRAVADYGLVRDETEAAGVSRVLSAAACTYVAAMASTLLMLLYFAFRAGLLGGRRD